MCVICVVDKARPTDKMVEAMYDCNNAGAGFAWRQDGYVQWEKGLKIAEAVERCRKLPIPFVAHFRIPTVGGARESLCHPFPVEKDASLELTGRTKGYVLFHNGHWVDWRKTVLASSIEHKLQVPTGKWSDSRAMAWVAAHHGLGILEMIDEKCIAFGPRDTEVFGAGWERIDKQSDQPWVSNDHWKHRVSGFTNFNRGQQCGADDDDQYEQYRVPYHSRPICLFSTCNKVRVHGSQFCWEHDKADKEKKEKERLEDETAKRKALAARSSEGNSEHPFRPGNETVQGGEDQQKEVEKGKEDDGAGVVEQSPDDQALMEDSKSTDANSLIRWARSFNPKKITGRNGHADADALDRIERLAKLAEGIVTVGPM